MREENCKKAAVKNGDKGKKTVAVMAAVALLLVLAVGGTVAYIATMVDPINNQFLPAKVSCAVSDGEPTAIRVENTGDIPAYIRAAIVVNWVDGEGNVYGIAPSYTLEINDQYWKMQTIQASEHIEEKYFYYKSPVAVRASTEALISKLTVSGEAPSEAYKLRVEVVAEAIQADGVDSNDKTAAESAWGVNPANFNGN